jgi:hypothetical protein
VSEPPKRKRRWFQFRLRTLLIVVTLFCAAGGYVIQQKKFVNDRWEIRYAVTKMNGGADGYHRTFIDLWSANDAEHSLPWLRTVFGDQSVRSIGLPVDVPLEFRNRVREMFPEADVIAIAGLVPGNKTIVAWPDDPPPDKRITPRNITARPLQ